jgi:hypothetical protein
MGAMPCFRTQDFARFLANAENPERQGTPDSGVAKLSCLTR